MTDEPFLPIPPPPRPVPEEPSYRRWAVWALVPTIAVPIAMILLGAFWPDDSATESTAGIVDDLAYVMFIAVVLALVPLAILWSVRRRSAGLRWFLFAVFAFFGFLVGWIGVAGISMARHPTWDDA